MAITAAQNNPIIVTGTTSTSDDITDDNITISALYWLRPTAQGHKLALQDKNGLELIEFYCDNDNESLSMTFPNGGLHVQGLYSDDMDSGTLYIYVV